MQQRKQHTAFAVDGYAITASCADCENAAALHHVKQILLSSFANNTAKNNSGDILAIPPEQRDNNSGGIKTLKHKQQRNGFRFGEIVLGYNIFAQLSDYRGKENRPQR